MKPLRIFTQTMLCGAIAWLAACSTWANWGVPMSEGVYGSQTGCAPGADPGYAPSMMPMMPAGGYGADCGGGYGYGYGPPMMDYRPMEYGPPSGVPCDPYGGGPMLGGLASGCRPVGLWGRLGTITGLGGGRTGNCRAGNCGAANCGGGTHGSGNFYGGGCGVFGCGKNGYNRGAYPKPFGLHQEAANPFSSFPGVGPTGEYVNLGDVCCGPHWYDVMVEAVFLQRDSDANLGLTSEGPRGLGPPNLVLSTADLDTGLNTGLRAAGRLQMNAVDSIEAIYLGGIDWSDTQTVLSNFNDLYSVYSDFGVDPLGGFEDTDQASLHTATLFSDLDSVEINCRRDWIGNHYKMSGAVLVGCRYLRLRDRFQFATVVTEHIDSVTDPTNPVVFGPGASQYDVSARNNMLGAQLGGELMFCVFPGLTVGTEGKIVVFGNRANQQTTFDATTGMIQLNESRSATIATYGSEVQAFFLWQFHPLAKLRGGYEALFLNNVATGPANFNPENVFVPRIPVLVTGEELLLHGFHAGLELGW